MLTSVRGHTNTLAMHLPQLSALYRSTRVVESVFMPHRRSSMISSTTVLAADTAADPDENTKSALRPRSTDQIPALQHGWPMPALLPAVSEAVLPIWSDAEVSSPQRFDMIFPGLEKEQLAARTSLQVHQSSKQDTVPLSGTFPFSKMSHQPIFNPRFPYLNFSD